MYTKRHIDPDTATWGLLSTGVTAGSWVGLSTILSGTPHVVFVVLFLSSFMMDMLIMCNLTWQRRAVNILVVSIAFMLVSTLAMIVLFNYRQFYIMEHVGMIAYSLIFTAFFVEHTPVEWGEACDRDCDRNCEENYATYATHATHATHANYTNYTNYTNHAMGLNASHPFPI
jgi:hypothetical protein